VAAGQHGSRQLPLKNMQNSGVGPKTAPTHPLWTSVMCALTAHESVRISRPWRENRAQNRSLSSDGRIKMCRRAQFHALVHVHDVCVDHPDTT
jgi:hypothetical protein